MSRIGGSHRERLCLLVVEDQPRVRDAIVALFDREPEYEVVQASCLADARGLLRRIDVAILDLGLPDGDGTQLIQELAAVNPRARAIVITSSIDPTVVEQALERGAAAVLNKLRDFDEVVPTIKRLRG